MSGGTGIAQKTAEDEMAFHDVDEADRLRQQAADTVDLNLKRLYRRLADLYERLARHTANGRVNSTKSEKR
jgi:hypothetical protein